MKRYARAAMRRGVGLYEYLFAALPNPVRDRYELLLEEVVKRGVPNTLAFNAAQFAQSVGSFLASVRAGEFSFRYAPSVSSPTLYSSVYACLISSMTGQLGQMTPEQKASWAAHFDKHQSSSDGLFRDQAVANELYEDSDWWGARHLALHVLPAYALLEHRPKHKLHYLDPYKKLDNLRTWLESHDWMRKVRPGNDFDNEVMNIACALQYERDYCEDERAGQAIAFIQDDLVKRINASTGMWGPTPETPPDLSRAVQFAYHLYAIFFYDAMELPMPHNVIDLTLHTQNELGGFGVPENSSACEDIDSIHILIRLSRQSAHRQHDVQMTLKRGLAWVLSNQNDDGGFVFRRNESLAYGHRLMTSKVNESAMFPTWFRSLSVALLNEHLFSNRDLHLPRLPGYYA